ncbi:dihydrodipicolinate synthase family protein, partial [Alicyclobacillus sendaiensis]
MAADKDVVSRLRGSIVPMVTPFLEDGSFDERAYRDLIEWQIESGSHGISCAGTTGEPSSLTVEEREYLFEVTVHAVRGRVPVVLGTGSTNHAETLRL